MGLSYFGDSKTKCYTYFEKTQDYFNHTFPVTARSPISLFLRKTKIISPLEIHIYIKNNSIRMLIMTLDVTVTNWKQLRHPSTNECTSKP